MHSHDSMKLEIIIPSAGESITEVAIGNWLAEDGSWVEKDQEIAEVETDKATLPLISPESGILKILVQPGEKVKPGDIACTIDTSVGFIPMDKPSLKDAPQPVTHMPAAEVVNQIPQRGVKVTPVAQQMMKQHDLDIDAIIQGLRKITRQDVEMVLSSQVKAPPPVSVETTAGRTYQKIPMSPLRRKLSKRLVSVKNETAMLTTFNEVDMSSLQNFRKKYQIRFQEKHGQKLGLVSFFVKACAEALQLFPMVNSMIDGDEIITPGFIDIAIAVQTDKGLMVPVIRNVHQLSIAGIEVALAALAQKARDSKLTMEEMTGGTFTITNGGIFGSMLSTPIINPPQSAILGMHNIRERAIVIDGRIEIRPIMYVALSYDHRLIDGRDSVGFLISIKEFIESPLKMAIESTDPEKALLDL